MCKKTLPACFMLLVSIPILFYGFDHWVIDCFDTCFDVDKLLEKKYNKRNCYKNMTDSIENTCKLCLKFINDHDFQIMDDGNLEILGILDIHIDNEIDEPFAVCGKCYSAMQKCFEFKSNCVYVEDYLTPFMEKGGTINLQEIEESRMKGTENCKICRLCLRVIQNGSFEPLDETKNENLLNDLKKCLPELELNSVLDAVICEQCISNLSALRDFQESCSQVTKSFKCQVPKEENGEHCVDNPNIATNDLNDDFVPVENKTEIVLDEINIETKPEIESVILDSAPENIKEELCHSFDSNTEHTAETTDVEITIPPDSEESLMFCCRFCTHQEKYKEDLNRHLAIHRQPLDDAIFECQKCTFTTKLKDTLQRHMAIHKKASNSTKFNCKICDYSTTHKQHIRKHVLVHESGSSRSRSYVIKKHTCQICNFATRYHSTFKKHLDIHEDPSKFKVWKCKLCEFVTNIKYHLKTHMLVHKTSSKVEPFKCQTCNYITLRKSSLTKHLLIHKSPSEIEYFKCKSCNYSTKHKYLLKKHVQVFQHSSEVEQFKCELCDFSTKHDHCFKKYMYKCQSCEYTTKYKKALKKHLLVHNTVKESYEEHLVTHKDPSKVEICNLTVHNKHDLEKHALDHKVPSDVKLFKCQSCGYSTIHENQINKHLVNCKQFNCELCDFNIEHDCFLKKHKLIDGEVTVFKCQKCDYSTEYKNAFKKHSLVHQTPVVLEVVECDKSEFASTSKASPQTDHAIHKDPLEFEIFKCAVCNWTVSDKSELERHMIAHKNPGGVQMFAQNAYYPVTGIFVMTSPPK